MPCEGIRSDELAVIAEKITAIRITITKMCHEDGIVSLRQVQLVAIPGSSKVYPVLGMASSSSFLDTAHGPVQALEPQGYWSSDADSTHWWKLTLGAIHTNVQIIIDWTTDLQIGSIAAQEYSIQTSAVDPASTWSVHFSQTGQWGDCEKARTDKIPPIQEKLVVFKVVVNMGCHPEYVGINHIVVNGYPVEKAEPIFQLSGRALASTYDSPPFEPNFAVKEPSYWMSKPEEEHWWMMTFDTVYSQTDITINWADLPSGETLAARDYAVDFQGDIRQQNLVWKVHHVATEVPCSAARTDVIPWNPQALQRIRFSISKACMGTKVVGIATVVVSGHAMDKQLYTIVPKATVSSELDDAHSGGEVHTSGGHWSSAAGNDNNWWEGEMPASYHNADLQVYWASWWEGVSLAPQFFEVLISMDGITWTTVYTKTRTKAEACAVIESVPEAIPVIEEPFNYIMINMTDSCSDEGYVGIKQITLKGEPAADVGTEPPLIDEIATSSESSSGNADDALVDGGHWLSACCDADGRPGRHWWALDMSAEYTHLVLLIRWTSQLELGDDLGNGAPATFSVEVALNPPVKYETVFKSSNSDCDASVQRTDTIPKIVVPVQWIRISSFDACRSDDRIALSRVSVSGYPLSMSGFTAITGVATASTVNDDDHNANKAVTSVPGFWLSVAAMPPHWWSIDLLVIYIDVRIAISWETSLQSGSTAALQYSVDSSINSLLWLVQYSEEAGDCEALVRIDEWPRIETLARFIRISSTKSCHIDGMVGITEVVVQGTIFTAPIYEVCGDVEASSYIPHHDVELVLSSSNWWQTKSTAAASHWMKLDLPAPFTNLYTVLDWKTDVGAPGDVKVSGGPVKNSLFVDVSSNGYTTTQMGIATEGTCTVNKPRVDGIHIQRQPGQVITLEAIEMCNQENFLALTEVAVFGTPLELQLYEIAGNATASTSSGGTSPGGPLLRVPEVWSSEAVVYPISTQWWSMDLATKFTNVYVRLWWGAAQIPSLYKMETSADEKEWKTHYTYDNDACGLKARQDVLPPVLLDTHYIRIFVVKSCYGGVSLKRANIKGYPLCTPKTGIYYPEGVVTGSSSLTPEYSPSNAFPGLGNAFWATEISPSHWWKVHLSWDYSFVAITIQWAPPLGSGPLAARNYFVSSSLDGVKWIQDFSRMDAPCDAFERVDALPLNAALVRFIMIEIDVSCHPDNIVGIYRVLIRGHSANEPPATLPPLPAITGGPTKTPTAEPTIAPTDQPVMVPTFEPTLAPVELALPEAPTELLCSGLGEMSATLGWVTPADGGSPITMFRVYAKLPDDDGFAPLGEGGEDSDFPTDAPPAGGDMIENDVGGLRSGQKYKFKVSAITPVGEGPLSGSVECTTKGTAKQVSNAPGGDEEGGGASGGVGLILYIFVGLVVFLACVLGVIAVLVTYNSRGSFFGYSNVEVSESHTEKHDRRSRRDDRDGGDYRRFDDDPGYRGGGGGRGGYSRFDDGPGGRNPDYFHHDSAALSEHRPRHHDDEHHGRHHGESHSGGHHSSHHRSAHEDSLNDWMQIARDNYFIFFTDTRTLYIPYSTAISIHDGTHVLLDDAEYAKLKRRAAKDSVTFVELDEGEWPTRPLHTLTPAQVATILDSEEVESFAALIRKHRVNGRMLADMQERDIEELAGGGPDALDALNTIVQRMKRDRAIEVQLDPGTLTGTKLVLVSPRPKYSRVDANGIPTHDAAGNPLPEEEIAALRAEFEATGKIADVTASQARGDKPKYSHVDANGIPTHDASGNPLPEEEIAALRAEFEATGKIADVTASQARGDKPKYSHVDANGIPTHDASGNPLPEEEIAGLTASLVDAPQKYESELYSHFDANGTPTHDASGKPLPKEVIAALRAEMETTGKIAGVTASQVKGDTPQKYSRFAADGISTHSTSGKPLPEKEIAALRVKKEKKEKQQAKKEAMLLKRKERQAKEEDSGDPSSSKPVGFNLRRPKQVRASRHADEHAALPVMGGSVTILEIPQNVDELESLFDQSTQDQQVAVMAKQKAASASLKAKLKQRRMQRRNSTASALKAGPEVHLVKPKQVRASRHADGPTVAMPIFGGAAPVLDLLELEDTAAEVEASRIRRKRTTTTTTSETIVTTTTTACRWLEENSDEMVDEGDIVEKLRSGVLLCTVLRQIEGSGMTRFHVDAKASGSDAKSGANFVMVRSSCRRLGIADSFVLTPADLDRRDLPRIVSCLAALSEFKRTTTTVEGIEMIVKWLSEQSGEVVSEADIVEKLRSGVLLCTILRKIDGSSMDRFHTDARASVDDAKSGANFLMIRSSCRALSIEDKLILTPADLDRRDLARIVLCLTALATLTSAASAASPKAEVLKRRRRHMTTMTTTTTTTMTMTTVLNWLQAYYEEEISESDIAEKLRSGVLLCTILRQLDGSRMTRFHADADASGADAKSGANFVMIRSSCRHLGIADGLILTAADLDRRDLERIVSCLAALVELTSSSSSVTTSATTTTRTVLRWLQRYSDEVSESNIVEKLRSGVLLCTVLRQLSGSGMTRFHADASASGDDAKSGANFVMIRSSCRRLAIDDALILAPADLDRRDLPRIVSCLAALAEHDRSRNSAPERSSGAAASGNNSSSSALALCVAWLQAQQFSVDRASIAESLRSGVLLCSVLEQINGASIAHFHRTAQSGAHARANFVLYRAACRRVGIADDAIIRQEDVVRNDVDRIVPCLRTLIDLAEKRQTTTKGEVSPPQAESRVV